MPTATERYETLREHREQFLQRARHNAMLTVPSLMPLEGHDGQAHLIEPYQSLGALGVVSMSSRMTMAMLPAGRPHLRFGVPPQVELAEFPEGIPSQVQRKLSKSETLVQNAVERANWRASTLGVMQQLIVAGSLTVELLEDQTFRLHRLDNFVWRRDARGLVLECIIREFWDPEALPDGVLEPTGNAGTGASLGYKSTSDDVETYIVINYKSSDDTYTLHKETKAGKRFGPELEWARQDIPFLFLRWSETPGEDYGRSKVEEVVGDLRSYDSLSKQSLEHGAMAAANFLMVRPGANANGIRRRILSRANGDVIIGDPDSVDVKQFANGPGHQITENITSKLEERLSRAFLLLSTQQRNAERVTATEIERDVQELESTLGGIFSTLSLEYLERATSLLINDMKDKQEFPAVDDSKLQTTILTGLEALSRERDVGRGVQAAQIISQFGPEAVQRVKLDQILDKILLGLGFADSIKTQEEFERDIQVAREAELAQQAAGPAVNAVAKLASAGGRQ